MFSIRPIIISLAAVALLIPSAFAEEIAVPDAQEQVHEVIKGDTLWDIATAYLEDPFMWPKIWWQNKQVANPDLIFPGGSIRIPVALLKPEIREQIAAKVAMPVEAVEVVVEKGTINPLVVESAGFITKKVTSVGKVIGTHGEHFLMGQDDNIFMKMKKGKEIMPGDRYQVIRPVRNVYHPTSHKKLGKLVKVLGLVTVTGREGKLTQAHVDRSFDVINSADLLVPYEEPEVTVSDDRPDAHGVIVASQDGRTLLGSDEVVYLDRGSRDGLEPGVALTVIRKGNRIDPDGVWGSYRLPERAVATLRVLSVREGNATARIERALEHLEIGDRFEQATSIEGAV